MRKHLRPPTTPLLALLRDLETDDKRNEFAMLAGTTRVYLYQLAGCNTQACRSRLAKSIADASVAMHERYGTQAISMETLATMCPLPAARVLAG